MSREPLRTPEPFSSIINAVTDRDRERFERNPRLSAFVRQPVPGEFWPQDDSRIGAVLVLFVRPGHRIRAPITGALPHQIDVPSLAAQVRRRAESMGIWDLEEAGR